MSISEQDQKELSELRRRQAEEAWQQFFKKHPDVLDNVANRRMFAGRFIVRHPETGQFLGETIPTLQTLEDAFDTLRGNVSYVERHKQTEIEPAPPSQLDVINEYNDRLRNADKETLRNVERVRSAMFYGLVPNSAEWQQRRLPIVTEEINYFLNPPQSLPAAYSTPTFTAPQLSEAEIELGARLKAKGIDISCDRSSVVRWLHSESDNDMAQVRNFLRDSNGRIDRANEAALQAVLSGGR